LFNCEIKLEFTLTDIY